MSDPIITGEQVQDWLMAIREGERDLAQARLYSWTQHIATHLFAQAVTRPHGVNEETPPDYEQMAKDAFAKAQETAPYLLRELGLLPKEGE